MREELKRLLPHILDPKAMIFGFTLFNFTWMWVRESRIEWQIIDYHGSFENTLSVFLLLLAALGLLLNRWWGWLAAVVLSGRVIYVHVFSALLSVSYAHDVRMFSRFALRNWWWIMYEAQPQYIIQIALAVVICIYSVVLLIKWACGRQTITGGITTHPARPG